MKVTTPNALLLHEEILLLALKDREGTMAGGSMYEYAVGGAILAELLLEKRIRVRESRRNKLVEILSSKRMGDALIDECLDKVAAAKRRASLQTWVSRFASVKQMKHRLAEQLCRRGILRADEDKVLLIFTRKIYPEVNPEPERQLIERIQEAVFTDRQDIDPRTIVLVSLANGADLLKAIFGKKELKARKARIDQLVNGEVIGKATQEVIEAIQAAVMVAAIMPAMMSTVTMSN